MAYYAVVDDFRAGMPQTILNFRPRGIACHTTEGAEGEAGALGTMRFLIEAASRNASYHELWYAKNGGFEARRIVRPDRAAHSMNPGQPSPWTPDARVRRILGDRWWDPNAYSYAVSVAGSTGVTAPALIRDYGFMLGARRRTAELLAQFGTTLSDDPLFNHGEGQNNRTDWGTLLRPAIEDDMAWYHNIDILDPPERVLIRKEGAHRVSPDLSAKSGPIWLEQDTWKTIIATVQGEDFGAGPVWDVYVSGGSTVGLKTTHSQDALKRVKLSGGGYTADDLEAARKLGLAEGKKAGQADMKTRATVAVQGLKIT